jgi:toxin ParE1/3/4
MRSKTVLRRSQAQKDTERAADHYFDEGGLPLEARFIDALEAAIKRIAVNPGVGSPRYASVLAIPGLRFWRLSKFPYLVFYVEREDQVDVWRVLHEQRDLPRRFAPDSDAS